VNAIILGIGLMVTLVAISFAMNSRLDNTEKTITMLIYVLGCTAIVGGFIAEKIHTYESDILADHIDNDKTRVIKENDKVKELYITVDGKEYHFTFKED
jgi:flagellar biosynthesis protein FliQ